MPLKYNLNAPNLDDAKPIACDDKISPLTFETAQLAKRKSFRLAIKEIYFEFCSNTSIHGFQYFGQRRPWKEIFFWICIFLVSIYFCSSIIVKIYLKWDDTPVIVSFAEKSTPIWNIPFPAVTICSETKRARNGSDLSFYDLYVTYLSKAYNLSHSNSTEFRNLLTLMHVCDTLDEYTRLPALSLPAIDYIETLNEMLPDFETHYMWCEWFGAQTECSELFTKVYTDGGVCYTFNSLKSTDLYRENTFQYKESLARSSEDSGPRNRSLIWSLEQGYGHDRTLSTYPARVLSSGATEGLLLRLQTFQNETDCSCSGASKGFKILLHSPDDVPSVSKHFVRMGMDRETLIAVKPKMITTSADIAAYPPHKRQCHLNSDRDLKFFKVYSQNNCERECLTNFTLTLCGCVKFSMPRTPDMPVCDEHKISCYTNARKKLLREQFTEGLKSAETNSEYVSECNCLPACTSLEYETEISEGDFDLVNELKAFDSLDDYFKEYPGGRMSQMVIYFKDNQFITSRRSELYGLTELLANFGGVCGLFMGISILSIIEMLYHFTLRLWSNVTRRWNKSCE